MVDERGRKSSEKKQQSIISENAQKLLNGEKNITLSSENEVIVFASDLKKEHSEGLEYNSYAIPTLKGPNVEGVNKDEIKMSIKELTGYVERFIEEAKKHSDKQFVVTPIGTGIDKDVNGYGEEQIALLFKKVQEEGIKNIHLPKLFKEELNKQKTADEKEKGEKIKKEKEEQKMKQEKEVEEKKKELNKTDEKPLDTPSNAPAKIVTTSSQPERTKESRWSKEEKKDKVVTNDGKDKKLGEKNEVVEDEKKSKKEKSERKGGWISRTWNSIWSIPGNVADTMSSRDPNKQGHAGKNFLRGLTWTPLVSPVLRTAQVGLNFVSDLMPWHRKHKFSTTKESRKKLWGSK